MPQLEEQKLGVSGIMAASEMGDSWIEGLEPGTPVWVVRHYEPNTLGSFVGPSRSAGHALVKYAYTPGGPRITWDTPLDRIRPVDFGYEAEVDDAAMGANDGLTLTGGLLGFAGGLGASFLTRALFGKQVATDPTPQCPQDRGTTVFVRSGIADAALAALCVGVGYFADAPAFYAAAGGVAVGAVATEVPLLSDVHNALTGGSCG